MIKVAVDQYHFRAGAGRRLFTVSGTNDGDRIRSAGSMGCILYGPYISLPAGRYTSEIIVDYDAEIAFDSGFSFDVAINKGFVIPSELKGIFESGDQKKIIVLSFVLHNDADDLEVRLYKIDKLSEITIHELKIWRVEGLLPALPQDFLQHKFLRHLKPDLVSGMPSELRSSRVRIIQTADPIRYSKMLVVSSRINKEVCDKLGFEYEAFMGIRHGIYPHHAMYNRTALLKDAIRSGYSGWVVYMDADAIIRQPEYFSHDRFDNLRAAKISGLFHPVYENFSRTFWGDINDGVFFMDMGCPYIRALVSAWDALYAEFYGASDYSAAKKWHSILDDQSALQWIINNNRSILEPLFRFEQFQGSAIFQALRSNNAEISSDEDLEARIQEMEKFSCEDRFIET